MKFKKAGDDLALDGVVTVTDWLRALGRGALPETPVTELMVRHPITVTVEDNGAPAAEVVREHRVKPLPVVQSRTSRRLVGCLPTRRLMAHVFKRIAPPLGHRPSMPQGPATLKARNGVTALQEV